MFANHSGMEVVDLTSELEQSTLDNVPSIKNTSTPPTPAEELSRSLEAARVAENNIRSANSEPRERIAGQEGKRIVRRYEVGNKVSVAILKQSRTVTGLRYVIGVIVEVCRKADFYRIQTPYGTLNRAVHIKSMNPLSASYDVTLGVKTKISLH